LPYTSLRNTHKGETTANGWQLALLKAGIEGWNEWRQKKTWADVDLFGAALRAANLTEAASA